jgi:hypothetical protein
MEQTVETLEEVSIRLGSIQDSLLPLASSEQGVAPTQSEERTEPTDLQSLLNQIEIIKRMLDQVELETDILEKRISTIENLRTRQSG